jgi:hypothetical protein
MDPKFAQQQQEKIIEITEMIFWGERGRLRSKKD